MRRLYLCLAVAGLALLAAGCGLTGDDDDDDSEGELAVPGEEELEVGEIPEAPESQQRPEPVIIPASQVQDTGGVGEGEGVYVVQEGDFCGSIAQEHGITVEELQAANPDLDCDALQVGEELQIPAVEEEEADDDEAADDTADDDTADDDAAGGSTYTVVAGDTAGAIADACGITVDELATLNGTTVEELNSLEVGQELTVPEGCEP
jgi:LysM repeat protein